MKRFLAVLCLIIGLFLVGFSSNNPDLSQYQRLPLRVRLKRLLHAGRELFLQRRFEEAMAIFEVMDEIDPRNLDSLLWRKKCEQQIFRENNELLKTEIIKRQGSLRTKESGFENWVWGPTVGHFEIRTSKPKPRIIPPKKIRPPASDAELQAATEKAKSSDPEALFELAILHNTRQELQSGINAFEKAVEQDPGILAKDDEGLTAKVLGEFEEALIHGRATPEQRMLAAKVAFLQGDWAQTIRQFIKAGSKDPALKTAAEAGLRRIIETGKTEFLQRLPEITLFQQAYSHEGNKDKLYLWIQFAPKNSLYLFPFDFEFEQAAIKEIKVNSPDILAVIPDPFTIDTTRLWVIGKDPDDRERSFNFKAEITLDESVISELDLSNYLVESTLPGNWSYVFGERDSFYPGFPIPKVEKEENGLVLKAFQLSYSHGKGPIVYLPDFRKPGKTKVDVWAKMEEVLKSEGYFQF